MSLHLSQALTDLQREILAMGSMVEEASNRAIRSLIHRDPALARQVIDDGHLIDSREVAIEEGCLRILALHQPVAGDLRWLVTILKVNNDLERMGDLAINIAKRASYLAERSALGVPLDFNHMLRTVSRMVGGSLDALCRLDTALAHTVCAMDSEVDAVYRRMFVVLQHLMKRDPASVERAVHTLSASRHLERIADLATNIAEDVIFLVDGEVVRHRLEEFATAGPRG